MFIRFLSFARRYRWRLLLATGLMLVTTSLSLLMPYITGVLVDHLAPFSVQMEGVEGTSLFADAPVSRPAGGGLGAQSALVTIAIVLGAMALIHLLRAGISFAEQMLVLLVGNRILFDLRQRLFRHLQRLSLRFYEENSHGWIMSRILYDVDAVQATLSGNLIQLISNSLLLIGALVIVFALNWQLALIPTVALPLYVFNFLGLRRAIRREAAEQRDQFSQVYSLLSEDISGVKIVKCFTREQWEARRFVKEIRGHLRRSLRLGRLQISLGVNAQLITALANLAVLGFGSYLIVSAGTISVGQLMAFLGYTGMLFGPIIALVTVNDVINRAMAAVDRIFDTLDTPPEIRESRESLRLTHVEGRVELRNVHFSYEPTEPVLRDINLVAEPGQMIALVGPSGSGKTTLVHLIPRFYDPQLGEILLDGHDLREISLRSLRQQMSMVLQEDFLFSGSLRENIKYGRPAATDEQVVQAAIAANAHDFIMEFPDGYETQVGERGDRLSGGQRQRISIARAILRNPRLLILDEATSDLDSESEALIQDALEKLMKGRTTFTIAHRLSTVMNADQILVLDHGQVVERGTHAELATAGGLYAKLCEVQFKRGQEKIAEHEARLAAEAEESG